MFDPFDANQWRAKIVELDGNVKQFETTRRALASYTGALTPTEYRARSALLARANGLHKQLVLLYVGLKGIRDGVKAPPYGLSAAPLIPIGVVVTIAGITAVTLSVLDWLRDLNGSGLALKLIKAGVPAKDALVAAGSFSSQSSAKIFGFDIRWLLALGAAALAFPFIREQFK